MPLLSDNFHFNNSTFQVRSQSWTRLVDSGHVTCSGRWYWYTRYSLHQWKNRNTNTVQVKLNKSATIFTSYISQTSHRNRRCSPLLPPLRPHTATSHQVSGPKLLRFHATAADTLAMLAV